MIGYPAAAPTPSPQHGDARASTTSTQAWVPPARYGERPPFPAARYSGVRRRLAAALIDAALVACGTLLFAAAVVASVAVTPVDTTDPNAAANLPGGFVLLTVGTITLYFVGSWRRWGATLGMALLHIRVVDAATLRRPTIGQALGRFAFLYLLTTPALIGVLVALRDPRRRGWHDRVSGTAVIEA